MHYVGIDVHKRYLAVCVLNKSGEVVSERRRLGNTAEAVLELDAAGNSSGPPPSNERSCATECTKRRVKTFFSPFNRSEDVGPVRTPSRYQAQRPPDGGLLHPCAPLFQRRERRRAVPSPRAAHASGEARGTPAST
jgi:hypothetical protein